MSTSPGAAQLEPGAAPTGELPGSAGTASWRGRRWAPLAETAAAVVLGLLAGALLLLISGVDPLSAYSALLDGSIGSWLSMQLVLVQFAPLLIIALGLAPAFRARVWNIGADGQFQMGAVVATVVLLTIHMPSSVIALPAAMVAGALAAGLVGVGIGVLRARWEINEVITSLLSNYIIAFLLDFLVRRPFTDTSGAATLQSKPIPQVGLLPLLGNSQVHIGLLIALGLVPIVAWMMGRTPFGFKTRVVGLNAEAGEAAGIVTRKVIVRTMLISGAFAGLAGTIQLMGSELRLTPSISNGIGFTAIIVALLGRLNAFGIVFAALLIACLTVGGGTMEVRTGASSDIVLAIEGLIVLFVLLSSRLRFFRGGSR